MIPWYCAFVAFLAGAFFGVLILALVIAGKDE